MTNTTPTRQSPWSPAFITAIGGAVAVVLTALAAVLVTLQGIQRDSRERGEKADQKANTIIEKAAEIHTLTNKNFGDLTAKLEVAQAKIDEMQKVIKANASDKKVADDLAAKMAEAPAK